LIDEAIDRAGGVGLDSRLGVKGYAPLPLERLVASRVDLLVEPRTPARAPSLGFALLNHPALIRRFSQTKRLALPGNLTDCPAPASAALVPILGRAFAGADEAGRE
jgi:iron complex transport system substrate-binding protein